MNHVEAILRDNIDDPAALFVFPTDIAVSRWADHLLRLKSEDSGTIPMNKFIAWDKFKQKSIKSKVLNKKSIPSALRKIFISRLVMENSEAVKLGKTPLFSALIMVKWAQQAQQFAPWLTGILPQLGVWFTQKTKLSIENILDAEAEKACAKFEDDDRDMYVLAYRYAQFMREYSLFEPAWETPPFNSDGMNCFIFFPEALSDFCEYRELLSASSHVKIITSENTENLKSHTFYYTNARREITEAALYIRALHEKQDIAWDSIVVCIPDTQSYEPYVLREFSNRNIPFVKRTSKPLTDFPAGQFFQSVIDCASQDFAFSAFIGLVLNKNLPWKDAEKINRLVNFGIKNNCICSWTEEEDDILQQNLPRKELHVNVWEDAFNSPFEYLDAESRGFFHELKRHLHALRSANSFRELRKQYFIFREHFFDMDLCSEETNLVLSRCIAELMDLTELENNFPKVKAPDPFIFLAEYLSEVNYLAQTKVTGVAILPYKTAATAPFDCHIILGAVQNNISVVYSRLNFLPKKKREELGIIDEDASLPFIRFHKFNSQKISAFFCSEFTFSGFEIAHSKIEAPLKPKENYCDTPEYCEYFSEDYYRSEIDFKASDNYFLHDNQINGFTEWKNRRKTASGESNKPVSEVTLNYIKKKLAYNPEYQDKISVSASSLKTYYQCSLKWLFNRILGLDNTEIETSLMSEDLSGTVYHAALDMFFTEIKNKEEIISKPDISDNGAVLPSSYKILLQNCIEKIFNGFPSLSHETSLQEQDSETTGGKIQMSALTARFLRASKTQFYQNLENFLAGFLSFFKGCSVVGCETWYQTYKETYFLNGKSDCILKDKNGNYIIIDFKLASLPGRKDCTGEGDNGLCDFQLPMYISLTEENKNIEINTALFFSIIKIKPEVIIGYVHNEINEIDFPKKEQDRIIRSGEAYKQLFEIFNKKVKQFADEIITGNFTIFESDFNECYNCEFSRICRKVYTIKNEKNISLGKHE